MNWVIFCFFLPVHTTVCNTCCTVHVYVVCMWQIFCISEPGAVQMCPRERQSKGHMDKVTWAHHVLLLQAWWTGFTQQSSHCVCVSVRLYWWKQHCKCVLFVQLVLLLFPWQNGLRLWGSFSPILILLLALELLTWCIWQTYFLTDVSSIMVVYTGLTAIPIVATRQKAGKEG